ncbi:aminodeoxychorismate lyase [Cytobacillus sp. Hz8]|uniref:aminodeoxychorismate lyase n=1 Tax=Cytobacillus sp. Hz8 TaxID=3347168 RepID=UPI0035D88033
MNKQSLRAFSFGIFFTVCIIASYYYLFHHENKTLSASDAISFLKEKNYVILTKEKYDDLVKNQSSTKPKSENAQKNSTKQKTATNKKKEITYQLVITSGMSSEEIATILENQGIIEDKAKLTNYMSEHDYSTKIQLGKFPLTDQMSLEQIAKIISKS